MNIPIFVMSFYRASKYINPKIIPLAKKTTQLLKNHGYQIHFLCNDIAFTDFKEIKWDYVDVCLNGLNPEYKFVWSLSKIEAYKRCCSLYDKFYHIDQDIFIFEPLEEKSLEENIIVQEGESPTRYSEMSTLKETCGFLPSIFNIDMPDVFYNMGFFGGKSASLKPLVESCLDFIYHPNNKDFLTNIKYYDGLTQALLPEQGFFSYYVKALNIPVYCIREHAKDYFHYGLHKSMSDRVYTDSLEELKMFFRNNPR